MATLEQREATYHCGIGKLLKAAYQRDFNMLEAGKCKRKFVTFDEWYDTLNTDQRKRVDALLEGIYQKSAVKPGPSGRGYKA